MADTTLTMLLRADVEQSLGAIRQLQGELGALTSAPADAPALDAIGDAAAEAAAPVEQLGDAMRKTTASGGNAPATGMLDRLRKLAQAAVQPVAAIGAAMRRATGTASGVAAAMLARIRAGARAAGAALASVGRQIGSVASKGGNWLAAQGARALKWGLVSLLAVLTAVGVGTAKFGVEQEQTRLKFQTMLGSVAKGNVLLKQLQDFANVTPFDTAEVVKSGQTLLSFGVAAADVQGELQKIGDIAAGTGKPLAELSAIYGKVMTKGKMDTEALNQLSEAGVPIIDTLAKKYGVAAGEIYAMAEKGKLTSQDLSDAFAMLTSEGGMFEGMMAKQSETVGGLWSTLVGVLKTAAGTLGEQLAPLAAKVLQYFVGWANSLKDLVDSGNLIDYFGNVAIVAITAFAEIINRANQFKNMFVATMQTLGAIVMTVWSGIKTGILRVITGIVAMVETMVNTVIHAYNGIASVLGRKKVDVNFNWTEAMADQTAEEGKNTGKWAGKSFDGGYYGQAIVDSENSAKEIDKFRTGVENLITNGVRDLKAENAKRTSTEGGDLGAGKSKTAAVAPAGEKNQKNRVDVDSLTKIGMYNFGAGISTNLDRERNNLLQDIVDKLGMPLPERTKLA